MVKSNFVRILENSKRFIATKGMLKQEKCNIKMEGKLCVFSFAPAPPSSPA